MATPARAPAFVTPAPKYRGAQASAFPPPEPEEQEDEFDQGGELGPTQPIDFDLVFFDVASSDPQPSSFMQTVSKCILAARTRALQARKPPPVASLIQATFGKLPAKAQKAAPGHGAATALPRHKDSALIAFPLVGLSTSLVDRDPVVASLREERQLWRLVGLIEQFRLAQLALLSHAAELAPVRQQSLDGGAAEASRGRPADVPAVGPECAFSVGAALPGDEVASERQIVEALAQFDSEFSLLQLFQQWLQAAAEDDAQVINSSGHVTTIAATELILGDAVPDATFGTEPSILGAERLMWKDSMQQLYEAARVSKADDNIFDAALNETLQGAASASGLLASFHPDAVLVSTPTGPTGAASVSKLAEGDLQVEVDLLQSIWTLLRSGKPHLAQILAARYGQPWRAAMLAGSDVWSDEDAGDGMHMLRRGNAQWPLFKQAAVAAAERLAALYTAERAQLQGTASRLALRAQELDLALMLHLGGLCERVVDIPAAVGTWHDACWEFATAAVQQRVESAVRLHRQKQARADACLPFQPPQEDVPTVRTTTFDVLAALSRHSRPEIQEVKHTGFAMVVETLLQLAAAFTPSLSRSQHGSTQVTSSSSAGMSAWSMEINTAILAVLKMLRAVVCDKDDKCLAALAANKCALTADHADSYERCFSTLAPDNVLRASDCAESHVSMMRFAVHLVLYFRYSSPLSSEPVLQVRKDPSSPPAVEHLRQACIEVCDDIILAYVRHLMLAFPNNSSYLNAILALLPHASMPRAVRSLTSFFLSLPHEPSRELAQNDLTAPAPRAQAFESYELLGGSVNTQVQSIFVSALRNVVRLHSRMDESEVAALAQHLHPDTDIGALEPHDVFVLAGLCPPRAPPVAVLRLLGLSVFDYVRVCSLEWLLLGGMALVPDLLIHSNMLARRIVNRSIRSQDASAAVALRWMYVGVQLDPAGPSLPLEKRGSHALAHSATAVAHSVEFSSPVLSTEVADAFRTLTMRDAVSEYGGWYSFANLQAAHSRCQACISKPPPQAPTQPSQSLIKPALTTETDKRNYRHALDLHASLVQARGSELIDALRLVLAAVGRVLDLLPTFLLADVLEVTDASSVPVIGKQYSDVPPARELRTAVCGFVASQLQSACDETGAWLAMDAVATANFGQTHREAVLEANEVLMRLHAV